MTPKRPCAPSAASSIAASRPESSPVSGRPRIFRGISASIGVAIGRVYLLDRRQVRAPRFHIQPDQVGYEIDRLSKAIDKSVEQLEAIRSRFLGGGRDHQSILEAHEM